MAVIGAVVGIGAVAAAITYWYCTHQRQPYQGLKSEECMQQLVHVNENLPKAAMHEISKPTDDTYQPPKLNDTDSTTTQRRMLPSEHKKATGRVAQHKRTLPKLKEVSSIVQHNHQPSDIVLAESATTVLSEVSSAVPTTGMGAKLNDAIPETAASGDANYTRSATAAAFATAGVPMSDEDFSYWWEDLACGLTIAAARVHRKITQLRERQEFKMRHDAALALQMYGLEPEDVALNIPVPVQERTLQTSNFLVICKCDCRSEALPIYVKRFCILYSLLLLRLASMHVQVTSVCRFTLNSSYLCMLFYPQFIDNKLNERLDKLGKFPCMYVITAAQELVRTHSNKGSGIRNHWLSEFQVLLEEVLVNPDFENDVGSTGSFCSHGTCRALGRANRHLFLPFDAQLSFYGPARDFYLAATTAAPAARSVLSCATF